MSGTLALALLALTATAVPMESPKPSDIIARWVRGSAVDGPRVNVWLNRDEIYSRGDDARVYFKSDRDAYVTIMRVDTDGRLRILFPIDPWEDNFARGGRTFEVLGRDRDEAFRVDDYPGVGYVFAVASGDPFTYDEIIRGDHWDYRTISDGRIRGDPYVAVLDMADRIVPAGEYDYDVAEYSVERHYDYPRFVCYDCHAYASWRYWDPYSAYCSRFRIVIYDDWYYYPYRRRHYGGTVIVRPFRPGPRYVFKDADPRNDYITRVAARPRDGGDDRRSPVERDRTSTDVGGRGAIPAPVSPRRRSPDASAPRTGGDEVRRRPETRKPAEAGPEAQTPSEPRRRVAPDRTREPGPSREPSTRREPSTSHEPSTRREPSTSREPSTRREPSTSREPSTNRDRSTPSAEPRRRSESRVVEPRPHATERRDEPKAREPSRQPSRESVRNAPSERSRGEPRVKAPSPPRSSGEPQLKRRRPD